MINKPIKCKFRLADISSVKIDRPDSTTDYFLAIASLLDCKAKSPKIILQQVENYSPTLGNFLQHLKSFVDCIYNNQVFGGGIALGTTIKPVAKILFTHIERTPLDFEYIESYLYKITRTYWAAAAEEEAVKLRYLLGETKVEWYELPDSQAHRVLCVKDLCKGFNNLIQQQKIHQGYTMWG